MIYTQQWSSSLWQLSSNGMSSSAVYSSTSDNFTNNFIDIDLTNYDYYGDIYYSYTAFTNAPNQVYIGWRGYTSNNATVTNYYILNTGKVTTSQSFVRKIQKINFGSTVAKIKGRLINRYNTTDSDSSCFLTVHPMRLIEVPKNARININKNGEVKASDFREFDNIDASIGQSHLIEGVQLYEY